VFRITSFKEQQTDDITLEFLPLYISLSVCFNERYIVMMKFRAFIHYISFHLVSIEIKCMDNMSKFFYKREGSSFILTIGQPVNV
jgi:hypothetical protein